MGCNILGNDFLENGGTVQVVYVWWYMRMVMVKGVYAVYLGVCGMCVSVNEWDIGKWVMDRVLRIGDGVGGCISREQYKGLYIVAFI